MGQPECPNCSNSDDLNSNGRDANDPDLLYEVRRLSEMINVLQTEIQNPIRNRWLTTQEAARYARMSVKQIRRAVKAGLLKCGKRVGQWRFKREWIDKYIINN